MSKQNQVTIFGAGGHAKVVIDAFRLKHGTVNISVYDDAQHKQGTNLLGVSVETPVPSNFELLGDIHIAIGNNKIRQRLGSRLILIDNNYVGVTHPTASVSAFAVLGKGHFIAAGAIVAADARLGDGVIINHQAVVDHDCNIGSWAHIAPGAVLGGGVKVGYGALIGAGAVVLPGVEIGSNVIVGAGAVVTKDVADSFTVIGVPARLRG